MALEGKVKIPLVGEVGKKPALIGGAVFAAFIGFMYIRHRNNASTTNASPGGGTAAGAAGDTGMVTDPAGNQCAALGASGYCPGTEQDLAFSDQAGYAGYDSGLGSGYGGYTGSGYGGQGLYVDPNGNTCAVPGPDGYCPTVNNPSSPGYANNEQWLEAAEKAVPGSALHTAAARIFAGLSVTAAQKDVFLEAVGLIGPPPAGYPAIHLRDTKQHPEKSKIAVPVVTGERRIEAAAKLRTAGLDPHVVTKGHIPAGKEAVVINTEPNGGEEVEKGTRVTVNVGPR